MLLSWNSSWVKLKSACLKRVYQIKLALLHWFFWFYFIALISGLTCITTSGCIIQLIQPCNSLEIGIQNQTVRVFYSLWGLLSQQLLSWYRSLGYFTSRSRAGATLETLKINRLLASVPTAQQLSLMLCTGLLCGEEFKEGVFEGQAVHTLLWEW